MKKRSGRRAERPCLRYGVLTDGGKQRPENQDAFVADPELGLFAVADGMGGANAGALASKIVVGILPGIIKALPSAHRSRRAARIRSYLRRGILRLSGRLRTESSGQIGLHGMGATLVMALLRGKQVHIAHMGDSRCYLFRKGKLRQLTEDHSIVSILLRRGEITSEQAKDHPARGTITRFIGMQGEVDADVRSVPLKTGDCLLLCSDGLTGMLPNWEIEKLVNEIPNPQSACQALVDAANLAGGKDNITVVIVKSSTSPPAPTPPTAPAPRR